MTAASDDDAPRDQSKPAPTSSTLGRSVRIVDGRMDSGDLFVNTREIIISHGGDRYRLRLTAQNKLILTK